jgi:hypothetical protein
MTRRIFWPKEEAEARGWTELHDEAFIICTLQQTLLDDQTKENEMGGVYTSTTLWGDEETQHFSQNTLAEDPKGIRYKSVDRIHTSRHAVLCMTLLITKSDIRGVSYIYCSLPKYYSCDKLKEYEMGGACGTHRICDKNIFRNFWSENLKRSF